MKHVKGVGAFLVLVAAIAYKFNLVLSKLTSLLKLGVIFLAMLHLSSAVDSAAVASKA